MRDTALRITGFSMLVLVSCADGDELTADVAELADVMNERVELVCGCTDSTGSRPCDLEAERIDGDEQACAERALEDVREGAAYARCRIDMERALSRCIESPGCGDDLPSACLGRYVLQLGDCNEISPSASTNLRDCSDDFFLLALPSE